MNRDELARLRRGDTVYVFNGYEIYTGTFANKMGMVTSNDLEHCPGAKIGDELYQIEFDYRLGLRPGPFGFTANCLFISFFAAGAAMAGFFKANPAAKKTALEALDKERRFERIKRTDLIIGQTYRPAMLLPN